MGAYRVAKTTRRAITRLVRHRAGYLKLMADHGWARRQPAFG